MVLLFTQRRSLLPIIQTHNHIGTITLIIEKLKFTAILVSFKHFVNFLLI